MLSPLHLCFTFYKESFAKTRAGPVKCCHSGFQMRKAFLLQLGLLVLVMLPRGIVAQTAIGSTYTLSTTARAVLTDVLVLDKEGNPITGLPESTFHLSDNGKPQHIASFEEHTSAMDVIAATPALPQSTYTNDTAHLPEVLNILVIDALSLSVPDQMYLSYQMERFIAALPAGESIAIYLRAGSHTIQVQGFTANHELMLNAVHHALPHLRRFIVGYESEAEALHQIAGDLVSLPGRKNVIWLTGAISPPFTLSALESERLASGLRQSYDELQAARIAVYPIDARGLVVNEALDMFQSQALMREVAEATGGTALYDNNGVAAQASAIVAHAENFYTLSYTPASLQFDGKWHRVRVQVDGKYRISYRRGYFADDSRRNVSNETRTRLGVAGKTIQEKPSDRLRPIVFTAKITAVKPSTTQSSPAYGQTRYAVHFSMAATGFDRHVVKGQSELKLGLGILAFDRYGTPLVRSVNEHDFNVNEDKLRLYPDTLVPATQLIDLNPGDTYLYLVVWDPTTERIGTMTVPLQVPKAK